VPGCEVGDFTGNSARRVSQCQKWNIQKYENLLSPFQHFWGRLPYRHLVIHPSYLNHQTFRELFNVDDCIIMLAIIIAAEPQSDIALVNLFEEQ
jgi:hypothetical protein